MKEILCLLVFFTGLTMFVWSIVSYRKLPKKLGPKRFTQIELAVAWHKAGYDVEVISLYHKYRGKIVIYRNQLHVRCYGNARPSSIEGRIISVNPVGEHRWALTRPMMYKSYAD